MTESKIMRCDEIVYPRERFGSFKGGKCGRPAKEGGKCGLHCASAAARRQRQSDETEARKNAMRNQMQIENAIALLRQRGFTIVPPRTNK